MVTAHPGASAQLQQLVLDAEADQAVAEVSDGLVVGEIGLCDPAFGPHTVHRKAADAVRFDGVSAVVLPYGTITGRRGTISGCAAR